MPSRIKGQLLSGHQLCRLPSHADWVPYSQAAVDIPLLSWWPHLYSSSADCYCDLFNIRRIPLATNVKLSTEYSDRTTPRKHDAWPRPILQNAEPCLPMLKNDIATVGGVMRHQFSVRSKRHSRTVWQSNRATLRRACRVDLSVIAGSQLPLVMVIQRNHDRNHRYS